MDKGDKQIRQKVNQARPYKPQADWDKMAGLLDGQEASAGGRYLFLRGFFVGAASLALLLAILWFSGTFSPNSNKMMVMQGPPRDYMHEPKAQLPLVHSPENTKELSSNASPTRTIPVPEQATLSQHGPTKRAVQPSAPSTPLSKTQANDKALAMHTKYPQADGLPNDKQTPKIQAQSQPVWQDNEADPVPGKLEKSVAHSFAQDHFQPSSVELYPQKAPILPLEREKKWSLGIHLNGLIQPYVANSPIAVDQNPFLYRWHPGVSVEFSRQVLKMWKFSLRGGTDDAYYYEGYIPAGGYEATSLNDLGNSVAVIVGTNYWVELSAKMKLRKKVGVLLDPYARVGLGHVWSRADFLAIFGINTDQLSDAQKTSRFQAKENLGTFVGNPYLLNNRTFVDASNALYSADELVTASYSAQNNLSEYHKQRFLSASFGLGTEIHLSPRWDLDLQANILSRLSSIVFNVPGSALADEFAGIPSNNPALEFPDKISFVQISVGMSWKF